MYGDQRDGQTATLTQFGQRRVGMVQHILLQPLQPRTPESRLASGIGRLGVHHTGIAIALDDILHRALGDSETLGDSSHGLAVLQTRRHDAFAKIYRGWFHGFHYTP